MIQTRQLASEVGIVAGADPVAILAVLTALIQCLQTLRGEKTSVEAVYDELRDNPVRFQRAAWRACRREGIPREKRPAVIEAIVSRCSDPVRVGWIVNEVAAIEEPTGEFAP